MSGIDHIASAKRLMFTSGREEMIAFQRSTILLPIGIILTFALVGGSPMIHAQSMCGSATTNPVCSQTCGQPSPPFLQATEGGAKNAYVIVASVYCSLCGWQASLVSRGTCIPPGVVTAINRPQIEQRLDALANGKQVLLPGCGGGFVYLSETQALAATTREPWQNLRERPLVR